MIYDSASIRLSDACTLKIGTWNCQGLSKIKKDIAKKLDKDILCLTETHMWRDGENDTIYSDCPSESDSWSGVALLINNRILPYVIDSGRVGSRITFCRLKGNITNYLVIGIYIPHQKKEAPCQNDTYNELEAVLRRASRHDCIIIMGDFNSRLSRSESGFVGRWCIHQKRDSGGDRLLDIMKQFSLRCVSTYFQPPRRHSNATYLNVQPQKPPSQIDYIIVSSRWSSSVRKCSTQWGLAIAAYGRKYDHAMVTATLKIRIKTDKRKSRKDFLSLKCPDIAKRHEDAIKAELARTACPNTASERLKRLNAAMQAAQSVLPKKSMKPGRKYDISEKTEQLLEMRKRTWNTLTDEERQNARKQISRSVRNDYREFVKSVVDDMEKANAIGKFSDTFKMAKQLSCKGKTTSCIQPAKDAQGNIITTTEQQLELWAEFLEKKFASDPNEPNVILTSGEEEAVPPITLEETSACVKMLSKGKAAGPDEVPIEQFQQSESACAALHDVITSIFDTEDVPEELVTGDMLMLYKKKLKDDRSNYRALGLLNHSYKTFSRVLLMRIIPFIEPKLSDMQAGFRRGRGCRDNILILTMAIHHLLERTGVGDSAGVITYIDFVAAFDSIYHSYMLESLKQYGVPLKYVRLVRAIYQHAAVRVRIQEKGGSRSYSRCIPIRRGAIQGDIPSPIAFLVALDRLLKEHGSLHTGIRLTDELLLSDLEFADDAALPNEDTDDASLRLTGLSENAKPAGMTISVPKTKAQHIRKKPKVSPTTEEDIANLPNEKKFKFECPACGMTYPTKHGLAVHRGRHCKGSKTAKKPSRRGTVADRIISRIKVDEYQKSLPIVKMGNEELENVYTFDYLGSTIAGDGDQLVALKNRSDIAWGRFNDYRTTLTSTKLPVDLRIRLHVALSISTLVYGSSAWLFDDNMKRSLNGISSKMLSAITRRTIHDEARDPTFNVIEYVLKRRRSYLGHILRMDPRRAVRRYLLELNPRVAPFVPGSLLDDTNCGTVEELLNHAEDRSYWKLI